jgi:hypothetical protein
MSWRNRTSSGSTAAEGRGAAAVPVREVLGCPGRPGWRTGAVGDVTAGAAVASSARVVQADRVAATTRPVAAATEVATARWRTLTAQRLGGSFYPIQRCSVLFA